MPKEPSAVNGDARGAIDTDEASAGTNVVSAAAGHANRVEVRADASSSQRHDRVSGHRQDPCIRAENEDDDGYDPYSDRRPEHEPLFERDPWD